MYHLIKNYLAILAQRNNERGYTLLEYCAGAAIIAGVIWVALSALGQNLTELLEALGLWASERTDAINENLTKK